MLLLYTLTVIYISEYMCTSMCLYAIMVCTDGMTVDMGPCFSSMMDYWTNG